MQVQFSAIVCMHRQKIENTHSNLYVLMVECAFVCIIASQHLDAFVCVVSFHSLSSHLHRWNLYSLHRLHVYAVFHRISDSSNFIWFMLLRPSIHSDQCIVQTFYCESNFVSYFIFSINNIGYDEERAEQKPGLNREYRDSCRFF